MLPSAARLKKKKDFDRVFDFGHASGGEFFVLKQAPNSLSLSRFGFVISTKTAAKAIDRNKLKRQASEIIRLNIKKIKTGFDVVIVFKRFAQGKEYIKLERELISLLIKSGLYLKS